MLSTTQKTKIIEKFKTHDGDTGSSEVQIAILSKEIDELAKHLKKHKKDLHSKRGLLQMVSKRRKLLDYLKSTNEESYNKVIKELGLKR
jgi:small subunit ribosomal protein S15